MVRKVRMYKNNKSGYRGVCLVEKQVWVATYGSRRLGAYKTKEEAVAARQAAERADAVKPSKPVRVRFGRDEART